VDAKRPELAARLVDHAQAQFPGFRIELHLVFATAQMRGTRGKVRRASAALSLRTPPQRGLEHPHAPVQVQHTPVVGLVVRASDIEV
jgi:hypothetical protein